MTDSMTIKTVDDFKRNAIEKDIEILAKIVLGDNLNIYQVNIALKYIQTEIQKYYTIAHSNETPEDNLKSFNHITSSVGGILLWGANYINWDLEMQKNSKSTKMQKIITISSIVCSSYMLFIAKIRGEGEE